MLTLNEKLELISALESENLSEEMIERVVYMEDHPDEWVGPFNTIEEFNAYLNSDDEEEET